MVDTVDTKVVFAGTRRYVTRLTNISDGTGESAVVKVDVSALTGPDGTPPTYTAVEKIEYDISGMTVRLYWDADTDDEIAVLSGAGFLDWSEAGGLVDPKSTGTTGDIVLTTNAHTAGDTYTITLYLILKD